MNDSSYAEDFLLKTNNLTLSYGRVRAVDRLNLAVRQGEVYGFLGRNGAGKTSTIRMLMGLIRPDAGEIELPDFRGRRIGTQQKQRIGYVSQEQHFYPWMTCRQLGRFVGGFYPSWERDEFERLLKVLDLPPHRKSRHLSGGMRVKLALALALAHRPPILILDEPTSGLDPVARREFLEIVRSQARTHNRTTFFSSHLIDEVERVADRVGIIHRGRLRYEGDIPSLQASIRRVRYLHRPPAPEHAVVDAVPADAGAPQTAVVVAELVAPAEPNARPRHTDHHEAAEARNRFRQLAETNGFCVLGDDFDDPRAMVLSADSETWEKAPFPATDVTRLSLEDIFIALAGEATPNL